MEPWTNSGRHRLCSLRCGHLFGRQCIDRWLAGGRIKCPQCNAPAKRADIRVLYCKSLVALDTSERDRLEGQIETYKIECRRLEESLAQANLSSQILRAELESLKLELSRLKKRKFSDDGNFDSLRRRGPLKFLRRAILGHGQSFQCRTVAFDCNYGIFLVSRSDGEGSGGIVKVSLWDATGSEFVSLHDGAIRAVACSPHGDGLFLTCAADDRLKLSTMSSNSVLQTWNLPSSPWSCTFHPSSINHVAVGLTLGQVAIYDIRCPTSVPPKIYKIPDSNYPVHSVFIVKLPEDSSFVLVGATLEGPFAFKLEDFELDESERSADTERFEPQPFWSSNFGYKNFVCCSLSFDSKTAKFLASFRSVPPRDPSRHVIFELIDSGLRLPFQEFKSESTQANKIPFRSCIYNSESFIPDESDFTVHCYNSNNKSCEQEEILSTNAGIPLIETCAGSIVKRKSDDSSEERETTLVVGLLTAKNLYIYTSE